MLHASKVIYLLIFTLVDNTCICKHIFRPPIKRNFPLSSLEEAGEEPLYLTPYIESGDIETGQSLAAVDWTLLEGTFASFTYLSKP